MSPVTKLTLTMTITDPHDDAILSWCKYKSCIDESNDIFSRSSIFFHSGIVAKLTSATEFSAAEDLS